MAQLLVECKHCGHRIDPNEEDTKWGPPLRPGEQSLGSIRCPECGAREDFIDWKSITNVQAAQPAADIGSEKETTTQETQGASRQTDPNLSS